MYSKLNKTNNPKPPSVEENQKPKNKKYKQIIKHISYTNKHVKQQPQIQKPNGGNNGKRWRKPYNGYSGKRWRKPYNNHRENLTSSFDGWARRICTVGRDGDGSSAAVARLG
jgi:hypothetical protein